MQIQDKLRRAQLEKVLLAQMSDVSVRINIGTLSGILVGFEMLNGVFILIRTHEGNVRS